MKNHLGENVQQTYNGWIRAIKAKHPSAVIEGNKDIAFAFIHDTTSPIGKRGAGEWTGDAGCQYLTQNQIELQKLKTRLKQATRDANEAARLADKADRNGHQDSLAGYVDDYECYNRDVEEITAQINQLTTQK